MPHVVESNPNYNWTTLASYYHLELDSYVYLLRSGDAWAVRKMPMDNVKPLHTMRVKSEKRARHVYSNPEKIR